MTLSLCIPGYNRPAFLRWTLNRLQRDFPGAEIVVSDDASSEDLSALKRDCTVKWIQQEKNIGPFPNHRAAILGASGTYAAYCANDDYLVPERVCEALAYLDAHPECSAYIAPCDTWDEVNRKSLWGAFKGEDRTFTRADGMELFNFIIQNHVWPEHVIYRTPAAIKPRTRAYWCFVDLVDLLEAGTIHFGAHPFYRNLLVHPIGEREQLGNVQCLTFFDEYRAGLEVLAYGLFGEPGHKARLRLQEMIGAFICQRLYNASVLYARQGNLASAEMLQKRLAVAWPGEMMPKAAA